MSIAKPTIIGINVSHNASCALMVDGKIVAACQEERFSRTKNHIGIPYKSIEFCLEASKLEIADISEVVICGKLQMPFYLSIAKSAGVEVKSQIIGINNIFHFFRYSILHSFALRFPFLGSVDFMLTWLIDHIAGPTVRSRLIEDLASNLKIEREKISFLDHHSVHAATAYYLSPFCGKSESVLVFTADGGGDELCATVSIGKGGKLRKISSTSISSSIAYLYMYTTLYLGLKPLEDEYKIMGLAPYGKKEVVDEIFEKLKGFITIDKTTLKFRSKVNSNLYYRYLDKIYKEKRFDNVSGAIQKLLEEKILEWVEAACIRYKIKNVAFAGGLFANVKLNQKITELDEVKEAFFAPSPGDESNSIGACYLRFKQLRPNLDTYPVSNLYLGPESNSEALAQVVKLARVKSYSVFKPHDINLKIAEILASGEIVARVVGKCEFGTRALGNRSILADPSRLEVKDILNSAIKSRDFWMPFAPAILEEQANKYLINPKRIKSPFMMQTFKTNEQTRKEIIAAIHPLDKTARAQIVEKSQNIEFWDLINKFYKLTGRAALLNTSFNLHGEPIVLSPLDAFKTFENSSLKYLQMEGYLIEKKLKS